jgi:hypothetical protein
VTSLEVKYLWRYSSGGLSEITFSDSFLFEIIFELLPKYSLINLLFFNGESNLLADALPGDKSITGLDGIFISYFDKAAYVF